MACALAGSRMSRQAAAHRQRRTVGQSLRGAARCRMAGHARLKRSTSTARRRQRSQVEALGSSATAASASARCRSRTAMRSRRDNRACCPLRRVNPRPASSVGASPRASATRPSCSQRRQCGASGASRCRAASSSPSRRSGSAAGVISARRWPAASGRSTAQSSAAWRRHRCGRNRPAPGRCRRE